MQIAEIAMQLVLSATVLISKRQRGYDVIIRIVTMLCLADGLMMPGMAQQHDEAPHCHAGQSSLHRVATAVAMMPTTRQFHHEIDATTDDCSFRR